MAGAGGVDAVLDEVCEIEVGAHERSLFETGLSGFEDLLDGAEKAVGVVEHQAVKLFALGFVHVAALQGLQV